MRFKPWKVTIRSILVVAVVGFILTALTGCGIGHGFYWHGYDGRSSYNKTDYHRNGYDYSGNVSNFSKNIPGNMSGGSTIRYDNGRRSFCW